MKKKYTVGSMFAGIGGICIAFKNAGCEVKWANEFDKNACITYKTNFPKTNLFEKDVTKLKNPSELGKVDIIVSGFPCQAFSVAGYRKGFNDDRGNLFFETARFIDELKPKAFLLENVKNLVGHDKGKTFRIIKETIKDKLNYSFIPFVLNSKDFGNIPQTRERIYVVGFKNENKYENTDKNYKSNIFTLNFNIPEKIELTKTIHNILLEEKQDDYFYYKKGHSYYPELIKEMKNKDTVYQWRRIYVRENKSNVCPTLTANMGTGGHNVPLILDDFGIRKLTPRECARFQGFPDNFILPDSMARSHLYKQIGNSVTIPVVERISKEIVRVLNLKRK